MQLTRDNYSRERVKNDFKQAAWYAIRPASNRKPATYRCPLCGGHLASMSAHMLVTPEGDPQRRRHAHSHCVMQARKAGRLPLREDAFPPGPGFFTRLVARVRGGG
jgi:hypothetical protein